MKEVTLHKRICIGKISMIMYQKKVLEEWPCSKQPKILMPGLYNATITQVKSLIGLMSQEDHKIP